jgi:hypothetical protein
MTLANTRENGVRSLSVTCELCQHKALMNVDAPSTARGESPSAPGWRLGWAAGALAIESQRDVMNFWPYLN